MIMSIVIMKTMNMVNNKMYQTFLPLQAISFLCQERIKPSILKAMFSLQGETKSC